MLKRCKAGSHDLPGTCRALIAALAVLPALNACDRGPPSPAPHVKQIFHLNPYERDLGYSQAVLSDKTLYISGSVAVDGNGHLEAPGDMAGQMRAAYANIRSTLAAHGAGFEQIVKETIYTTNMNAMMKASDVRLEYYDKERLPAVSWVQVERLVDPAFLVEIDVIAELP